MSVQGPLLSWRALPFPLPWDEIFEGDGPLHLEIGFGDARYTVRRALADPGGRYVGLEISTGSVMRGIRRVKREGAVNVKLIKVGAQFAVRHFFTPRSLESIVVNFPDPWPKEKHAGNRLLQRPFLDVAASRLKPGGAILLATDHPEYLEFAREQGVRSGLFDLEEREAPPEVFETKYALKWKEQGIPLHYLAFVRNDSPVQDFPILERPAQMPHSLLAGELPENLQLSKRVIAYGDGHVILHEVAHSLPDQPAERYLVRATVDEPDLKQQLLVLVQRRESGDLIVRLEPFGDPVITKTVRGAVHAVTEWLLEGSGPRLVERNY